MIRILELFGGIGACSKALERLGIDYEIADYVEIDKYAVKSFNAMHNTNFEPQDICEWDKDIDVDLVMHGSPCQDFSLAGLQAGGDEGSGTRSSLMYETLRIVEKLKPKYVIWENVKNMISKKHIHNFYKYLEKMNELGYASYYQVLNAKDYGIPQNRERVFTISIRNDVNNGFVFPEKQELKLKLKDMLEDQVDEKYYLSEKNIDYICGNAINKDLKDIYNRENALFNKQIAYTLNTKNDRRLGDTNYVLEDVGGDSADISYPNGYGKGNRVHSGYVPCLASASIKQIIVKEDNMNELRIRKLTPKECWRLMGFDDSDFEKASKVNSNAQLYKQAGNSIVVDVLVAILRNLLLEPVEPKGQTNIFEYI